jgi:hypothetical protein
MNIGRVIDFYTSLHSGYSFSCLAITATVSLTDIERLTGLQHTLQSSI